MSVYYCSLGRDSWGVSVEAGYSATISCWVFVMAVDLYSVNVIHKFSALNNRFSLISRWLSTIRNVAQFRSFNVERSSDICKVIWFFCYLLKLQFGNWFFLLLATILIFMNVVLVVLVVLLLVMETIWLWKRMEMRNTENMAALHIIQIVLVWTVTVWIDLTKDLHLMHLSV